MRLNVLHDIRLTGSRLVVCDTVTEGVENTPIAGCKRRKAEWYTTRLLLHEICPTATIGYGTRGEPLLENSPEYTHLSISHGADKVAILLSQNDCGVDIECTTRNFDRVAPRFLNERERSLITPEHYPMAWSAKEALYKYFQGNEVEFLTDFEITELADNQLKIDHRDKDYVVSLMRQQNYVIAYL